MRVGTLSEMLEELIREGEEGAPRSRPTKTGRAGGPACDRPRGRVLAFLAPTGDRTAKPRSGPRGWLLDPGDDFDRGRRGRRRRPRPGPGIGRLGELESLGAEVLIVMPNGSLEDAHAQAMEHWEQLERLGAERVFAVDTAACFAEPGPQLIDGVELLAHLLHPELMEPPGGAGFALLRARCRGPKRPRSRRSRRRSRPGPSPRAPSESAAAPACPGRRE